MDKAASVVETWGSVPLILNKPCGAWRRTRDLPSLLLILTISSHLGRRFFFFIIMYLLVCDNRYADFLKACSVISF